MASPFGSSSYWEQRYKNQEPEFQFDWYLPYPALKGSVLEYFPPKDDPVLVVGCGNSRMPAQFCRDGFKNVSAVDSCKTVVQKMTSLHADYDGLTFLEMDVRRIDFPSEMFSLVIDKAMSDAIVCGDDGAEDLYEAHKEIWRVLRPGGRYIIISHTEPGGRLSHVQRKGLSWKVEYRNIPKSMEAAAIAGFDAPPDSVYHIYIMTKGQLTTVEEEDSDDEADL